MGEAVEGRSAVAEVEVAAHTVLLPRGTYCLYVMEVSAGLTPEDLPGLGISAAPGEEGGAVEVARLSGEPWLRQRGDAVLVRVQAASVRLLLTSYNLARALGATPPKIEIQRLDAAAAPAPEPVPEGPPQVVVHVRKRGDQGGRLGDWVGERGGDLWVEGFSVLPPPGLDPGEVEYQAVLGKGWFSPWVPGGEFCGSRGMQLPVLGLRLNLKGAAAGRYVASSTAIFVDGTTLGPVPAGELLALDTLQPVASLRFEIAPRPAIPAPPAATAPARRTRRARA